MQKELAGTVFEIPREIAPENICFILLLVHVNGDASVCMYACMPVTIDKSQVHVMTH